MHSRHWPQNILLGMFFTSLSSFIITLTQMLIMQSDSVVPRYCDVMRLSCIYARVDKVSGPLTLLSPHTVLKSKNSQPKTLRSKRNDILGNIRNAVVFLTVLKTVVFLLLPSVVHNTYSNTGIIQVKNTWIKLRKTLRFPRCHLEIGPKCQSAYFIARRDRFSGAPQNVLLTTLAAQVKGAEVDKATFR